MMKNKLLLLITIAIAISTVGCNKNESSESSSQFETTGTIATSQSESTTNSTDNNFDSSNISQLDFDFDEAIQNINLFGKKISLPCKFEELGEDFSLNEEIEIEVEGSKDRLFPLLYKGKTIAMIVLRDCEENDADKSKKEVIFLGLGDGFNNPMTNPDWYDGVLEIDILGITFDSSYEQIIDMLGNPTETVGAEDDYLKLYYKVSADDYFLIKLVNNKIVDFTISVEGDNYNGK